MPLAFPSTITASFFSTTLVSHPEPIDVVALYIPSNPFHSLANNIVPAVVLFSVILGVAVIGLERKQVLLDVLGVAGEAVARVTRFVVRLTPFGIFAIAATAAGTLDIRADRADPDLSRRLHRRVLCCSRSGCFRGWWRR